MHALVVRCFSLSLFLQVVSTELPSGPSGVAVKLTATGDLQCVLKGLRPSIRVCTHVSSFVRVRPMIYHSNLVLFVKSLPTCTYIVHKH